MTTRTALATLIACSLATFGAEAATIAKKHHAHKAETPAAEQTAAPADAAPAEAAPPKVVEPDPIQFGHAGSGTRY